MYNKIANTYPSLQQRGQVWCKTCKKTRRVDSADALKNGWPKCCGHTMTIDSPEEQIELAAKALKDRKTLDCVASDKCQINLQVKR